jgi:glycerophosphoryl diester phosphodiesterase
VSRPSLSPDRTTQPDQVEIIAHRGTPREYPENSLPGFHRALELGASGIELDAHLTADGVAVVHHDPALQMTPADPSPPRRIRELTAAELRTHDLAPGVPIPTLSEVLHLVGGRATVYVEIKAPQAEPVVLRCIASGTARCAVHGFDHRVALRVAQASAPEANGGAIPTGILSASYLIDPVAALRAAHARDYWQQWELIDEDLVSRIHDAGGRVIAWTVNAVSDARRLRAIGVDAICTDVCGELVAARIGQ